MSGTQDLYLKFTGGGGFLFNVNWWQFTGLASANLLTNPGFESGTTGWQVNGSGTLAATPSAKATVALTANGTTSYLQLTPAATVNATGWTQLSGSATVSWSGTLTRAVLYVETAAGTDNLYLDDASFQ